MPMAGVPKYTGLFGRDALVAGIQSAMLNASTLRGALSTLARQAATKVDDRFDAQPGKILHQRRLSPLALLGKNPLAHYYGDYSAPGLFVIGAALHFAHSGDRAAFESVRDQVLAALEWIDRDGDRDGDGFYEYETRADGGIKNQGWKDSRQAILYPDGSFTPDPIAVAEVQGICYAAKQSAACLFAAIGESERAAKLFADAAALKQRFNQRFWMEDQRFFALALGPDKKPVKTIASNVGACLAYGIIDEDKAQAVVDRLLAPDMFSGWGVRTLSSDHSAYNPLAYHLGSVWPVSNANICFGLKRYGFDDALHKVARAMFDAAGLFEYDRLPEVFGGHPRDGRRLHPGVYPESCSPQAWSASAVIQICHAIAGLTFAAPRNMLIIDPALPDWLPKMTLGKIAVGDKHARIVLELDQNGAVAHRVEAADPGLRILRLDRDLEPGQDRIARALAMIADPE
jgi:glycogen debranching enzyme